VLQRQTKGCVPGQLGLEIDPVAGELDLIELGQP
jgi:hypothetical protein